MWQEGLGKLITFNYLIGSQTHNLLAFSTVSQPLCYHVPPSNKNNNNKYDDDGDMM
jgi:hypothetical protein